MRWFKIFVYVCCSLFCVSCGSNRIDGTFHSATQSTPKKNDTTYIAYNQKGVALENENINLFLKRYSWQPEVTPTGLRIEILKNGSGELLKTGDEVTLKYKTKLLSGETVYSSQIDSLKYFIIDKSEEITGLHEAAKMLRRGSKARLVIPSYLAYGVAGDGMGIIGRRPLVMIVEVVDVQ
jgi:FKBP-type peptidyl-prolyl cis-trans isomerase